MPSPGPFLCLADEADFSPDKLKKIGLCETGRMLFDLYCLEPGQAQKVHVHDDIDKIYLVHSGQVTVQVGEASRVLSVGEAACALAGMAHGVRNHTSEPATVVVFQARGTL
ncbi:MAG: cupin domain-containing protein [Myxococcales bacterium]|nr:cupin domain-containing protein [Myxococcales bacterium]